MECSVEAYGVKREGQLELISKFVFIRKTAGLQRYACVCTGLGSVAISVITSDLTAAK